MTYQMLNSNTVVDYVRQVSTVGNLFGPGEALQAREVGDGNLNLVFIVGNDERKVVVKQAIPYLRCAGESWPLDRDRMRFESQALGLYGRLVPGLVPALYHCDLEMSLIIMEYLGAHVIMRRELVKRKQFPLFVDHISTFLSKTLFRTSDLFLNGAAKKGLQAQFINPELCKITEDFVFTNPYKESPENKWNALIDRTVADLRADSVLKSDIVELKEQFMTHAQALIHGDLHTGSIMINQDDTRVIDPEFAFIGPMGFDIGAVLGNLALNYCSHFAHTADSTVRREYHSYLLSMIRGSWQQFAHKFDELWRANNSGELCPADYWGYPGGDEAFASFRQRYLKQVLQDSAGFGGCKMMRRILGIAHVEDIESISDPMLRAEAERMALEVGRRWITRRRQFERIEDLTETIEEVTVCEGAPA